MLKVALKGGFHRDGKIAREMNPSRQRTGDKRGEGTGDKRGEGTGDERGEVTGEWMGKGTGNKKARPCQGGAGHRRVRAVGLGLGMGGDKAREFEGGKGVAGFIPRAILAFL